MSAEQNDLHGKSHSRDESGESEGLSVPRPSAHRLSFAGSIVDLEEISHLAAGAIDQIRSGCPLYKYTSHSTSPLLHKWHSRLFQVKGEGESMALTWRRDSIIDFRKERSILFSNMQDLRWGARQADHPGAKTNQARCFTVVYTVPPSTEPVTLFVCAKSDNDFKVWKNGLSTLFQSQRSAIATPNTTIDPEPSTAKPSPFSTQRASVSSHSRSPNDERSALGDNQQSSSHRSPTDPSIASAATTQTEARGTSQAEGGDANERQGSNERESEAILEKRSSRDTQALKDAADSYQTTATLKLAPPPERTPSMMKPAAPELKPASNLDTRSSLPSSRVHSPEPPLRRSWSRDGLFAMSSVLLNRRRSTSMQASPVSSPKLPHSESTSMLPELGSEWSLLSASQPGSRRSEGPAMNEVWRRDDGWKLGQRRSEIIVKEIVKEFNDKWAERQASLRRWTEEKESQLQLEAEEVDALLVTIEGLDELKAKISQRSLELADNVKKLNDVVKERGFATAREGASNKYPKLKKVEELLLEANKLILGNSSCLQRIVDTRTAVDKHLDDVPVPGPPSRLASAASALLNLLILCFVCFVCCVLPLRFLLRRLPCSLWLRSLLPQTSELQRGCLLLTGSPLWPPTLQSRLAAACGALHRTPPSTPWRPPTPFEALALPFARREVSGGSPARVGCDGGGCGEGRGAAGACAGVEANWARTRGAAFPYAARWWE